MLGVFLNSMNDGVKYKTLVVVQTLYIRGELGLLLGWNIVTLSGDKRVINSFTLSKLRLR